MKYLLLLLSGLFLGSCYVVSQAGPYLSHRIRSVPVEKLLNREDISTELREFLLEVQAVRRFAVEELGLASGRNFSRYTEVDGHTLAWVIQAADEFSTKPYLFSYPVVGKLPYRGFYNPEAAERYATRLRQRNLDVLVREVDAFSSLGFFSDPLFSFMQDYPLERLADLIIHEETHATVFIKGYPDFNEQLAVLVGRKGAGLYLEHKGLEVDSEERDKHRQRSALFRKEMFRLAGELEDLYARDIGKDQMRLLKQQKLEDFQKALELSFEINNAYVSLFGIYEESDRRLERVLDKKGSIAKLIAFFISFDEQGINPWAAVEELLADDN